MNQRKLLNNKKIKHKRPNKQKKLKAVKLTELKLLASNFGIKWLYNNDTNTHIMLDTLLKTETNLGDNPIRACNIYYTRVDVVARQRIGKSLEKQGKNRYTGENLS